MHHITPVILCGGSGTRLWPLSRTAFPKQFLVLSGKTTLFQQAVKRLQGLKNLSIKLNHTLIVTNEEHRFLALDQLREIKEVNAQLLLEPVSRNTAPALTLAALQAFDQGEDPILVVIPADQTIKDQVAFTKSLHDGIEVASKGSIVVLGIKPIKADTGFGYIKRDKLENEYHAATVLNFTEKPDALKVGDVIMRIDSRYFRPTEVENLLGDPSKARQKLGWHPEITAQDMCREMILSDLAEAQRNALLKKNGYKISFGVE
jgi:mannose-1-phosphate guanylyltransferase/mannose-6-phosphate isomerase